MQYRNLGRAGVKVSPLCLGTMMFGAWGNRDHADCIRIIHRALDAGINFIDTANMYSDGECEEIVGKALADRRREVVLATKVFFPMGPGPNDRGLSRPAIHTQVEDSLRRLGTEVIDLYQIHRHDVSVPWEETLSTLDDLVRQGKVRYVGASTNHYRVGDQPALAAWELVETFWLCERNGWQRFVSLQPPYSILRRAMERDHFPMSRAHGVANIVWSPLEGGWLADRYRFGGTPDTESPRYERWIQDLEDPKFEPRSRVVAELSKWVAEKGVPMAEFALAWVLDNPAVTAAIIGPRTAEQLDSCLRCLEVEITDRDRSWIDELVPPGTVAL